MNNIKNLLTIIIPCKNEEEYIERTLNNINTQNKISGVVVYISDAESTDNTLNIISSFENNSNNNLEIKIIEGGKVSVGRNNGLKLVNTPYVLFMDADATLENNNQINEYLNCMINNDLYLMTSPLYCIVEDKYAKIMFKSFNALNKILSNIQPFAVGLFFMTKTDIIKKLGGFDESVIHSEDYLLSKKYNRRKFKIGKYKVGQDNRRFKRFGYFKMIKLLSNGLLYQNNIDYFRIDNNYWN